MSQRITKRWIAGGAALALALSGCETLPAPGAQAAYEAYRNEGVRPAFNVGFNYNDGLVVDNAFVASQYYEGTARAGRAEVAFQAGLKEQAGALAVEIEQHLAHVEQALGRDYPLPVRAYLLRRDRMPGTIAGSFQKTSEVFQFPLFAVDGEESFETIRSTNPFYPYMFVHELTKLSLVDPARPPLVLADQRSNPLVKIEYNTRWFREGLANYAEYLVYERLRARAEAEGDPLALSPFESSHVYQKPLSALAALGPAVLDWPAFGETARDPDYFNASLGLFLLVEDQFGEGAVRRVLDELETAEYVDGTVIETAFNRALNTDIRRLATDFALPAPGAETSTLTPATAKNYGLRAGSGLYVNNVAEGGLAKAAGLQRGDVIVQINRRPVANTLDAELAMLEAKRHGNVYFTIDRMGERQTLGTRFNVPAAPGTGQSGVGPGLVTGDVLGFSGTE
ncbi:MAG: PDZ domain-containing protein [Candidatus Hydrogenedentes bacterium]|nr:PDZ domain-containing protein [Candidatus Hydrogenedentota bacterium]